MPGDLMPADRLDRIRAAAERTLTTTATVEAVIRAQDSAGGTTVAYGAPSAAVDARRSLPTRRELEEAAGRFGVIPAAVISLPVGTVVEASARITMADGTRWSVIGLLNRSDTWQLLERVAVVGL